MVDPEELLVKVSGGATLSAEDISELEQSFDATKDSIDDRYAALLLIRKADLRTLSHLVEGAIDDQDPLTVALALEILCLDWSAACDYLERVIHLALGSTWDTEGDARMMALKILGEYLRESGFLIKSKAVGKKSAAAQSGSVPSVTSEQAAQITTLLLSAVGDDTLEELIRQQAYVALLRAVGRGDEEIPSECVLLDFSPDSTDVDRSLLLQISSFVEQTPREFSTASGRHSESVEP